MNKLIVTAILVVSTVVPALAGPTLTVEDSYGTVRGGEYLITPFDFGFVPVSLGDEAGKFETFCLEMSEYLTFGDVYKVDFDTYAVGGGLGGQDGPLSDSLSAETAYLYDQFISGSLDGYDYTGQARVDSANALQEVIWYLEGELAYTPSWSTAMSDDGSLGYKFYHDALNNSSGIGSVLVMNLYTNTERIEHQSLLVKIIPAPGAVFLGGIGIALVGWLRRRGVT